MEYNERNDIWLFENDLAEYQVSDEGKAVFALLTYNDNDFLIKKYKTSKKKLKEAFEAYWTARNGSGLHYSDDTKLKSAKESDKAYAEAYREQN